MESNSCSLSGKYSQASTYRGWFERIASLHEFIIKKGDIPNFLHKLKIRYLVFFFMIFMLGSLQSYGVDVVITGPTTVCPKNATLHAFTAKSYQIPLGFEVNCGIYDWTVLKNGQIIEERVLFGSAFTYRFDDIGDYQINVTSSQCQFPFFGGSTSITVNSRVKMPNPITGPIMCNPGQTYSFTSDPSLSSQNNEDPDCYYHYAYLWKAPSGWNINGGGNTAFTTNTVNVAAPVNTPAGSYEISVQSSIHYGGIPIQDNSWFSTPRTYIVQIGPFNTSQITVSGTVAVCNGNLYTYSANVPGGHKSGYSYNWTYPAGWVIQSTEANFIQLYVPSNNSSYGTVRVSVNNGCGSPSPYTGVTVFPCSYMTAENFKIYPNPSDGELTVEYYDEDKDSQFDAFEIELFDKNEKLVNTATSESGKVKLETRNLQPGTYFLHIHFGKEVLRRQILVK